MCMDFIGGRNAVNDITCEGDYGKPSTRLKVGCLNKLEDIIVPNVQHCGMQIIYFMRLGEEKGCD